MSENTNKVYLIIPSTKRSFRWDIAEGVVSLSICQCVSLLHIFSETSRFQPNLVGSIDLGPSWRSLNLRRSSVALVYNIPRNKFHIQSLPVNNLYEYHELECRFVLFFLFLIWVLIVHHCRPVCVFA